MNCKHFDLKKRRDHRKNFLWASRLWFGRRKEPLLGYISKINMKQNSGTNGLRYKKNSEWCRDAKVIRVMQIWKQIFWYLNTDFFYQRKLSLFDCLQFSVFIVSWLLQFMLTYILLICLSYFLIFFLVIYIRYFLYLFMILLWFENVSLA